MILTRRNFLRSSVGTAVGVATLCITGEALAGEYNTEALEKVRINIPIPKLAKAFQNYKIGFLSDLHVGPWVPDEWITRAVNSVMEDKPDLILLGGDYIWVPDDPDWKIWGIVRNNLLDGVSKEGAPRIVFSKTRDLLAGLIAPDGVFGILGNHDNWVDPVECKLQLHRDGINLLINEETEIRRGNATLTVYGTDDYLTGVPRFPKNNSGADAVRILLTHNPDAVGWSLSKSLYDFDLALSGHTHGGQVKSKLLGAVTYNVEDQRFREGLVKIDGRYVYTTRGVGLVEVPYRLNCAPEVTVFSLVEG